MKAGLSEIFTAMNGIIFAGITPTREGHDTKEHPLADLAVRAAMESFDARAVLIGKPGQAEEVAGNLIRFLWNSRALLSQYPEVVLSAPHTGNTGGTVEDVKNHIADILSREQAAEQRQIDPVNRLTGMPAKPFRMGYLPSVPFHEKEEAEVTKPQRGAAAGFMAQFALT